MNSHRNVKHIGRSRGLTHYQNLPKSFSASAMIDSGIKHETLTINIGHLADSGKLEMSTIN